MNLLKIPKNRSLISELAYIALNVGLAAGLFAVVLAIKSPLTAIALVLLSKWRMLAVRPRFWFANIQSNLVDIIVGLSVVVLLYAAGSVAAQVFVTVFYVGWLLFIKPRSRRYFVALQASVATFLGVTTLYMVGYDWYASVIVVLMWIIGYSCARHVLSSYREADRTLFAMIWGLIVAELGWLGYHWTFAYSLPGFGGVKLSQMALIVFALSFLAERVYSSYHHNEGAVRMHDIMLPAVFTASVVLCVLLFFNTLSASTV